MKVRIYDNGDRFADRYTLVIKNPDLPHTNDYYGFDNNPFHPQGYGQYRGDYPMERTYKHLGKLTLIESLPKEAQQYVKLIVKDYS